MRMEPAYIKTPIIDPDGNPAINVEIGLRPINGGLALNIMGIVVAFGRQDFINFLSIIDKGLETVVRPPQSPPEKISKKKKGKEALANQLG